MVYRRVRRILGRPSIPNENGVDPSIHSILEVSIVLCNLDLSKPPGAPGPAGSA